MKSKLNIEEGVILMFSIVIFGYTKPVLDMLLNKMWLNNRWTGRFYYSVGDRCHKYVVNVSTFNRKECLYRHDFIKMIEAQTPKTKKISID